MRDFSGKKEENDNTASGGSSVEFGRGVSGGGRGRGGRGGKEGREEGSLGEGFFFFVLE